MARMSSLLRLVTAKISAAIINKYGDNGSPCLAPLSNSNYGVLILWFNTQLVIPLQNVSTHLIRVGPKPKASKHFNIKVQSILSNDVGLQFSK